ncbi:MAG: PKD domain-containing protein, partial [Chitinophagaceae bacterium]
RGSFPVTLVINNRVGCSDTLTKPLYIRSGEPTAKFGVASPGTCINTQINFTDSSFSDGVYPITNWIWNYGDGVNENLTAPPFQHSYTLPGIYSVSLKVVDSNNCTDSIRRFDYVIISKPLASFRSDDTASCPGKPIQFVNISSGPGLIYAWNFGDGNSSALQNPVHRYSADGNYSVFLKITDIYGCVDTLRRPDYIRVLSPQAEFSMSDSISSCPPLVVVFTNTSINYSTLSWEFGDGTSSNLLSPTHFYTKPGVYQARLKITSQGGCVSEKTRQVIVSGPSGSFSYEPFRGCSPLQMNFKALTQNSVSFIWDFNDGSTISTTDSLISHVYTILGKYLPKLILVDPLGCQVAITGIDSIEVYGVNASYTSSTSTVCDSGLVRFTNTSIFNNAIVSHQWEFGDGGTSTLENPQHFYNQAGIYTTQLIVVTQAGCRDTMSIPIPIKIVTSPVTAIDGDTSGCATKFVTFTGVLLQPDTSALTWKWNFGNGDTSTLQNPPQQIYPVAGTYPVRLVTTNSSGCKDTVDRSVLVHPIPSVIADQDTTLCRGQSYTFSATGASTYTWSPASTLSCVNCANPTATPDSATRYIVNGISGFGCINTDTVLINVQQKTFVTPGVGDTICLGRSTRLTASGTDIFEWQPTSGLSAANIASPIASPGQTTRYLVIGSDSKGCFRDSGYAIVTVYPYPTVDAGADKTISSGQNITLVPVISNDVNNVLWSPASGISSSQYPGIIAKPMATTEYMVEVTNEGNCKKSDKVTVFVTCNNANVFIPNTFSPNGDGGNDIFYIRGSGLFRVKLFRIFNRWGELIFEKANINANDVSGGWNGIFKGQILSPDVFVYTADILCDNNTTLILKGNVTLVQ